MKRQIMFIVLHCTATQPNVSVDNIKRYWREELKWKNPGYHYLVKPSGEIVKLQDENKIANGVAGNNEHSIHLSYIGGIDKAGKPKDTRSRAQETAMFNKIVELTERYPNAKVVGHRDFPGVKKACPSFDAKKWLAEYQPDLDNAA